MLNEFSRTQLLLGTEAIEKLAHSRVAVFGIGGVGGYTVSQAFEGRLFQRKANPATGGYEHQLPRPLYLPAGDKAPLHRQAGYPRLCGFRALGRWTDRRGRSGKGFV